MNRKSITVLVIIWIVTTLSTGKAYAQEEVTFSDENLEDVVREKIGKETGPIYKSDLRIITVIKVHREDIKRLDNGYLSAFRSYKPEELNISDNHFSDISSLIKLTDIEWLNISYNDIWDISPLLQNSGLDNGTISTYMAIYSPYIKSIEKYIPKLEERGAVFLGSVVVT
ncbi:MAG: hypothetical protein U9N35_07690 [Euryarchaeota archaeon]|nr:hypothetical protein [Euryarchaeota archaeon]